MLDLIRAHPLLIAAEAAALLGLLAAVYLWSVIADAVLT